MTILANAAWQVPVLPLRSDSLWCVLWRPSSSCGEGLKHSAYHSLHFMFPWVSSVQANKLQRWQADFCLTGQQARREGGRERRLQKFYCRADTSGNCGSLGYTYNLPQGPKPICEVNPWEKSPNMNTFTCATNKGNKKNIHCTLYMHLAFLDLKS